MTLVTKMEDLPEDLYAEDLKLFVCSTDQVLQRKVVDACDTLTSSLGPVSKRTPTVVLVFAVHTRRDGLDQTFFIQ